MHATGSSPPTALPRAPSVNSVKSVSPHRGRNPRCHLLLWVWQSFEHALSTMTIWIPKEQRFVRTSKIQPNFRGQNERSRMSAQKCPLHYHPVSLWLRNELWITTIKDKKPNKWDRKMRLYLKRLINRLGNCDALNFCNLLYCVIFSPNVCMYFAKDFGENPKKRFVRCSFPPNPPSQTAPRILLVQCTFHEHLIYI